MKSLTKIGFKKYTRILLHSSFSHELRPEKWKLTDMNNISDRQKFLV